MLLKFKCEHHRVAQKLVASSADLESIAADDGADVAALKGWRNTVFGTDALLLKHGRIALATNGRAIKVVPLGEEAGETAQENAATKASPSGRRRRSRRKPRAAAPSPEGMAREGTTPQDAPQDAPEV